MIASLVLQCYRADELILQWLCDRTLELQLCDMIMLDFGRLVTLCRVEFRDFASENSEENHVRTGLKRAEFIILLTTRDLEIVIENVVL